MRCAPTAGPCSPDGAKAMSLGRPGPSYLAGRPDSAPHPISQSECPEPPE